MTVITKMLKLQILYFIFFLNLYFSIASTTTVDYEDDESDEDKGNVFSRKSSARAVYDTIKATLSTTVTTKVDPRRNEETNVEDKVLPTYTPLLVTARKTAGYTSCKKWQCDITMPASSRQLSERKSNLCFFGDCNNKSFYITTKEYSSMTFHLACCNAGLQPAIIETRSEIDCLNTHFTKQIGSGELRAYTSIGDYTMTRKFVNCPSNKKISDELWAVGEPDNNKSQEMCADLLLCPRCERTGMYDVHCAGNKKVLCQEINNKTTLPNEPTVQTITQSFANGYAPTYSPGRREYLKVQVDCKTRTAICDPKRAMPTEPLKIITYARKMDMLFLNECNGKLFFITKGNVFSSWSSCCQVGLIPAHIRSREEFECIRADANLVTGLTNNVTAFTVHRDKYFNRTFMSCLDNSMIPDDLWIPGEPDNKGGTQVCALVNLCSNCKEPGFSDVDCSLLERALCETRDSSSPMVAMPSEIPITSSVIFRAIANPFVTVGVFRYGAPYEANKIKMLRNEPDCSKRIKSCFPNKKMPTDKSKIISFVREWNMLFLNECYGKMFFISKTTVMSSWSSCCQAGLIPADIKSKTELDCIRANANAVTGKSSVTAFTVHRDKYFNRTFMSCLDNSRVPDDLWIQGQPDNKGGTQVCALVNICSDCSEPGFSDVDCNLLDRALCQNRI